MIVESISTVASEVPGLPAIMEANQAFTPSPVQASALDGFGQMIHQGVGVVNRELLASQTDLQQLATGNAQNLHQIMIRLEETRLSFQLFMQVRNRLLEAYQDIMKMQV